MKPAQSSIYRELENLLLWFIPVGNNFPKDFALRELGKRMLNELADALTACALALKTQDLGHRLELINLVKLHIETAQSLSKVLIEYSSREGNVRRLISQKQRAAFITAMCGIGSQLARWAKSTESALQKASN